MKTLTARAGFSIPLSRAAYRHAAPAPVEQAEQDAAARAREAVQKHVARGAIQGARSIAFWEKMHAANASAAEAQMDKLPGKPVAAAQWSILVAARALRSSNPTAYASDVAALDAYLRTPAGCAAYQASLRANAPNGATAQAGVLAGARALRAANPTAYATDAEALAAFLLTAQGRAAYQAAALVVSPRRTAASVTSSPQTNVLAAARALRTANPTAYASDAAALDAYLRTPEGNAAYQESRLALRGTPQPQT